MTGPEHDAYLQSDERQRAVWDQKEHFLRGGEPDCAVVRGLILRSWERSRAAGVDVEAKERLQVEPERLRRVMEDNADLLACARDIIQSMFSALAGAASAMTLSSAEGITLFIANTAEHRNYYPDAKLGAVNTEEVRGTNGIGTCLAEGSPIEVIGAEHYRHSGRRWSCSAAPVFDPGGRLIGVLNVSQVREKYHPHTLGMVKAAVCAITEQLRLRSLVRQQTAIIEMLDDGVLVLSRTGRVELMNGKAAAMLGLDGVDLNEVSVDIRDRVRPCAALDRLLKIRRQTLDQELVLPLRSGSLSCFVSATPLAGGAGVVLTMREARRVRGFVARVSGPGASYTLERIEGESPALKRVIEQARLVAAGTGTVLLLGESGTGKELFAQAIHNAGPRAGGPFVAVNCGALPRNLVESELFGYEAGAFTGAARAGKPGKFELADGGTIFLDEIGEMPLDAQVSLLRVLENGEVTRVGGKTGRMVSVRVVAATNRDLERAVEQRAFREDLYYRLNVFPLQLPPLRERQGDVELLARYFLDKFARSLGKDVPDFAPDTLDILGRYAWPGNVRELENTVERMANIAPDGGPVGVDCLPPRLLVGAGAPGLPTGGTRGTRDIGRGAAGPPDTLAAREAEIMERVLRETGGNMRAAALRLGVSRGGLYVKMKRCGLRPGDYRAAGDTTD